MAKKPARVMRLVATDDATYRMLQRLPNQAHYEITLQAIPGEPDMILGANCYRTYPELETYTQQRIRNKKEDLA